MSSWRTLIFVGLAGLLAVFILEFSFSAISRRQTPSGCPAVTADGEFDPTQTVAFWQNRLISPPLAFKTTLSDRDRQVLGATSSDKWIEVDLTKQKLIAHQGDTVVLETLISSGLTNPTPTGEFRIWYKIRSTKMEGGSKTNNSYYYLPNVPFSMFFNGDYGIHGTYWHSNFGQRMSHGCVNTPTPMAEKLFYWTDPQIPPGKSLVRAAKDNPGTRVIIHY